jgi:hypothetical protein
MVEFWIISHPLVWNPCIAGVHSLVDAKPPLVDRMGKFTHPQQIHKFVELLKWLN